MSKPSAFLVALLAIAGSAHAAESTSPAAPDSELFKTVAGLDAQLFDAYNRCDLDAFRALLADDLEFYHDQGGLMLGPEAVTEADLDEIFAPLPSTEEWTPIT